MAKLRVCPTCHAVFREGVNFCDRDGSPLADRADRPDRKPPDPNLGKVIAGRFALREHLGKGATGVVYRATHQVLDRSFAVKILRRELLTDRTALLRFFREAKATSAVTHPNIVDIYDYGCTAEGDPYLVMEFVEGITLYGTLFLNAPDCLPPSQAIDITLQIGRALSHAHQRGVVHRDIKPENILLTHHDGYPDWVKVVDFGIARIIGQPALTSAGAVVGTPEFVAPEVASGEGEATPAADVYSLGILLHEVLTGTPPFQGDARGVLLQHLTTVPPLLSQRRKELRIPAELDRLTARLLLKDPAQRPSAADAVSELEEIRGLLPRRSQRSLHLQQTLILPPQPRRATEPVAPAGPAEQSPRPEAPTPITDRHGRPTMILNRQKAPTMLSPLFLEAIDLLEAEREEVSGRLAELVRGAGKTLWLASWPEAAAALQERISWGEHQEEELLTELALLREQAEKERERMQGRQSQLRLEVLALSERLRASPPLPLPTLEEQEETARLLEEKERLLLAGAGEGPRQPEAVRLAGEAERRLQEVREELQGARRRLGEMILATYCPPFMITERYHVEKALDRLKEIDAALAIQLTRAARGRP